MDEHARSCGAQAHIPSGHGPLAWEISPVALLKLLKSPDSDVVLIDCRTAEERKINRIEGSLHVPMDRLATGLESLGVLPLCGWAGTEARGVDEDRTIVVYCHHGRRSLAMTASLRRMGFESAQSLAGGIDRWSLEVDPSIPRY